MMALLLVVNLILLASLANGQETPELSPEEEYNLAQTASVDDISELTGSEQTSKEFAWLYVAAPVVLVVLFLGYLEIKRLKEHAQMIQKHASIKNNELKNYVMTNLRKGYTKDQIRNALAKNSYNKQEIEDAFRETK